MWQLILMVAIGYLLGSINLSILVTKYIGKVDLRKIGSGNAGGTNVARAMGPVWGILVIVAEMLKGIVLGFIARFAFPGDVFSLGELGGRIVGAIAVFGVLVGNVLPCFHSFKGGKGVSVCASAMLVIDYRVFIAIVAVFLISFLSSRMVSLGSVLAAVAAVVTVFVIWADPIHGFANAAPYWYILLALTAFMAGILIFRHRTNISRIVTGTENKFKLRKKD